MTEFKEIKRSLEKALNAKALSIAVPTAKWEAGTVIAADNLSVYLFKRKDGAGTVYYYATIGKTPISWHYKLIPGPETWIGENYKITKRKEGTMMNTIMDGVCNLGHFAPECLEEALK